VSTVFKSQQESGVWAASLSPDDKGSGLRRALSRRAMAYRKESTVNRIGKAALVIAGILTIGAGGCLPDNFWADKWGEIVNGLIVGAINLAIEGTGIQI
jgi:hypothetical protein